MSQTMSLERAATASSLIDVLDRVLDKGIVIDSWLLVSVAGIDLISVDAQIIVASIDTYLKYSNDAASRERLAWREHTDS
jgi:hypothetical protein